MKLVFLFGAMCLASTAEASLPAQVGGGQEALFFVEGDAPHYNLGFASSTVGDVDGDGFDDVLLGTPFFRSPVHFADIGRVEIHSGATGQRLLLIDGPSVDDWFGGAIAGLGDLDGDGHADFLVGSAFADTLLPDAGFAQVHSGATGSPMYVVYGTDWDGYFGMAVAALGDLDGDGVADFAVGAPGSNPGLGWYTGSVATYSGATGTLLWQVDGAVPSGGLGIVLSPAGDLNLDGISDLLVGSYQGNVPGQSGSLFVLSGVDGSLLLQVQDLWKFDSPYRLAATPDLSGDGIPDVLVSDPIGKHGTGDVVGAVMVLSGATGVEFRRHYGPSDGSLFGSSLTSGADLDLDGVEDYLVGASLADAAHRLDAGSVTAYSGQDGTPLQTWFGASTRDCFGTSVAIVGNANADPWPDLVMGATGMDGGGLQSGGALVTSFHPYLIAQGRSISASLGGSIPLSLDFPEAAAGWGYKVLLSATGAGPVSAGVDIPLSRDRFLDQSILGQYPWGPAANLHGTLSPQGDALADLLVPPGLPAHLVGRSVWIAAVAHDRGSLPAYSSIAIRLNLEP